MKCPECQSERITKAGFNWRKRERVQRYRCQNCGKLFIDNQVEKFKEAGASSNQERNLK